MEFSEFVEHAAAIEAEPADLETVDLVAALLADAGGDLEAVTRFVQGRVFPAWSERKLDVGPAAVYEALAQAAGPNVTAGDVEDRLADVGEIGAVAASYDLDSQRGLAAFTGDESEDDALSLADVVDELDAVAETEGSGSDKETVRRLFGLFNRCSSEEAKYLARLVLGEMRIGVGEGAVRDGIAAAFGVPAERVERALQVSNDYGLVARTARDAGEAGLDGIHLEIGRPVQAMLAQAGTVTDALDAWEEAAVETKYDGARVQLHYDGEDVQIFSRNMEEVTHALPEVVEFAEAELPVPAILDGEVVAVDADGNPRAFQHVLRRFRRKHDVAKAREDVPVELRAFDCLHAWGDDRLDDPLVDRHDALDALLGHTNAVSDLSVSGDVEEIEAFEAESLDAGHEGIMLKNPRSHYSPGKRGQNWLKRKPDVETLDLVVTGAEWGEGRRAELLGTFLLSARTEDGFETIGKVATGITDEELAELTDVLEPHVRHEEGQTVDIEPAVVFEVGYEEIQQSPTYSSGYALRFPRFVTVREDKTPATADSLERVERLVAND